MASGRPRGEQVLDGQSVKGKLILATGEIEAKPGVWHLTMDAEGVKMKLKISTLRMKEVDE